MNPEDLKDLGFSDVEINNPYDAIMEYRYMMQELQCALRLEHALRTGGMLVGSVDRHLSRVRSAQRRLDLDPFIL